MKNKEFGSDFHYLSDKDFFLDNKEKSLFYGERFSLFFSGRVALYSILKQGVEKNNWKKVYLPSFYCHEVTHFIKQLPIEVLYYEFNPFLDSSLHEIAIEDLSTTVIVNVDFYGLKKLDLQKFIKTIVVDDITHSLLSYKDSIADYCFGSLRKELPVPVGGFCYSPKMLDLPEVVISFESEKVAAQKLTAMFLKSEYLAGRFDDKAAFRTLYTSAEDDFEASFTTTAMPEIAKSVLFSIDIDKLLLRKNQNIEHALKLLKHSNEIELNFKSSHSSSFGLLIKCKNLENRNELRSHLIKNNIFPAILWPNQIQQRDIEIENTILFVHMDYRYNLSEIEYIINTINELF